MLFTANGKNGAANRHPCRTAVNYSSEPENNSFYSFAVVCSACNDEYEVVARVSWFRRIHVEICTTVLSSSVSRSLWNEASKFNTDLNTIDSKYFDKQPKWTGMEPDSRLQSIIIFMWRFFQMKSEIINLVRVSFSWLSKMTSIFWVEKLESCRAMRMMLSIFAQKRN